MTKSKQSLSKTVNLRDFSNAISPLGAVLTFAFCLLFFIFVLQPTSYDTKYTFELTQLLSTKSFLEYKFSYSNNEIPLVVLAGIVIGISQFDFLHKKSYLTTLLSFGVKRERLFRHRLLIPLITSVVVILITKLIALGINIKVLGFTDDLPFMFSSDLLSILKYFLFSYTATIVSCLFTGRTVEAVLSAISFTTISDIIIIFTKYTSSFTLYGKPYTDIFTDESKLVALNPLGGILSTAAEEKSINSDYTLSIISSVIWLTICIAVLFILTEYFKKNYKSERSGFKGICKPLVALVTCTLSFFVAIVFTTIADSTFFNMYSKNVILCTLALSIAGAFAVTAAIYLLIYKNSKKLKTAFIGSGVASGVIVITFIVCITGIFETYNKAPELDEIESITISNPFPEFTTEHYDGGFANTYTVGTQYSFTFTDEKDIKLICEAHELFSDTAEEQFESDFMLRYTLKNGEIKERNFDHINKETLEKILPLWDSEPVKALYCELLFPDYKAFEDFTYDYYEMGYYKEPMAVADFNSEYMALTFLSKHGVTTDLLKQRDEAFTERQYIALKNAVYKDLCEISYKDFFTPSAEYYGTLYFQKALMYSDGIFELPVTAAMKNTVAFLESLPFYNELMAKAEVKKMAVSDIESFMRFYNGEHMLNEYHEVCLSDDHELSAYTLSDNNAPVTMITDKKEMERILDNAYTFYLLGNSGKLVFVEFENGTYMTYGLPE